MINKTKILKWAAAAFVVGIFLGAFILLQAIG